jgi:hypothetical protein
LLELGRVKISATATTATATTTAAAVATATTAILREKSIRAQTERGSHRAYCKYSIQFHYVSFCRLGCRYFCIARQHHARAA